MRIVGVVIDDETGKEREVDLSKGEKKVKKRDFIRGDEELIESARVNRRRMREALEAGDMKRLMLMQGIRLRKRDKD